MCSSDLRGNLLEVKEPLERVLGYSRHEISGRNLKELLEPESWEDIRQSIIGQAGGGVSEPQKARLRCKSGQFATLTMTSRLVFENGNPVAVQSFGHELAPPDVDALRATLSTATSELARFTQNLKELHRLSTTNYESVSSAFADFLKTGCEIFGMTFGIIVRCEENDAVIEAAYGGSDFLRPGSRLNISQTPFGSVTARICTQVFASADSSDVHEELQVCIAAPILVGPELYGTLSFSSITAPAPSRFSGQDKEIADIMANGIGRYILENRITTEQKMAEMLVRTRNNVLEKVAENRPLTETLSELVLLVESQPESYRGVILLLENGVLSFGAGPGLPAPLLAEFRRRSFNPPESATNRSFDPAPFKFSIAFGFHFTTAYPFLSSGGKLLGLIALFSPQPDSDWHVDPQVIHTALRMASIAIEQKQLTERLAHQAGHDFLTGLPNRFRLLDLLDRRLTDAQFKASFVAVLFIDLDRFKQINDTLGHGAGDRLLIEVAERLKSGLTGPRDIAARMGGDEFAVVLSDPGSEENAVQISRNFLDLLRAPYLIDGRELFVTASIGISFFPKHGQDAALLLHMADAAMYQVKNEGKNALECFASESHEAALDRLDLENALRRALEKDEFELLFQPLVSMEGELDGFEVLLTWNHAQRGRIPPSQFIPLAEENGLIVPIGAWVLEKACQFGARWLKSGLPVRCISVNVSALQFSRPNFVDIVASALASTGLPPKVLELELTESIVLRDIGESIHRMNQMKELGVNIIIDDFGTGYSSLSYLRRLPVAGLKIDQSFLRDLKGASSALTVVKTIVLLAHDMALRVVAEGVETLEELEMVRSAGCDSVQGHLYGFSIQAAEAEKLLSRPNRKVPIVS